MQIINNFNLELLSTHLPSAFHSAPIVVHPDQFTDSQNHHDSEVWYIQQGCGTLTCNLAECSVKTGDLIVFNPFEHHAIYNNSTDDLRFTAYWYNDWEKINKVATEFFNSAATTKNVIILTKADSNSKNHEPSQSALAKVLNHNDASYIEINQEEKLHLKLDKYLIYKLGLRYEQSEYYLSHEKSLLTKFVQDVKHIPISLDTVYQALYILQQINNAGNSVILSNQSDFYTYAIFVPHIINILDQHALKYYPKIVLTEPINGCHDSINQQINLLLDILNKLNPYLTNYSNIIPEPGQWLSDDILFFNDIRKLMLEFNHFTQYETFNINSILLTIKKCALEISCYIDRSIQLTNLADERYSRTRMALNIHGVSVLLEMLQPFLCNMEEIMNKLLNTNFIHNSNQQQIQFGTQINFDQIIIQLRGR